jgi:hypothetical protein
VAKTDPAFQITHDDKCGEAEALTALHNLGDAIDVNELLGKLAVALFAITAAAAVSSLGTCHYKILSI